MKHPEILLVTALTASLIAGCGGDNKDASNEAMLQEAKSRRTDFTIDALRNRFSGEVILNECAVILEPVGSEYELSVVQNPFVLSHEPKDAEAAKIIPPFVMFAGIKEDGSPIFSDVEYLLDNEFLAIDQDWGSLSINGEQGWTGYFRRGSEVELQKPEDSEVPVIAREDEPAGAILYTDRVIDPRNWPSTVEQKAIDACSYAEEGSTMIAAMVIAP